MRQASEGQARAAEPGFAETYAEEFDFPCFDRFRASARRSCDRFFRRGIPLFYSGNGAVFYHRGDEPGLSADHGGDACLRGSDRGGEYYRRRALCRRRSESCSPMKHRSLYLSGIFLLALLFATAAGPSVSPYTFDQQDPSALLQPPSAAHWMGTDRLGRDLFTRVLAGGRLSISIGLFSAVTALVIGVLYGGAAGYGSDRTDQILMRGLDIVFALPDILLIILMMVVLGRGLLGIFLALTL